MSEEEVAQVEEPTPQEAPEVVEEQPTEETQVETPPEPEENKTPEWAQKRFDKLAAQKGEAQREAEYWKSRAMQPPEPQHQPQPEPTFQNELPILPDRFDFDDDDKYRAAQNEYQKNLGSYIHGENQRAQESLYNKVNLAKQQRSAEEFIGTIKTRGADKYEDFADVAFIPRGMESVFAQTQNAADIAYHLGQNPHDLERIMQLPPANAVFEIARLDAKFSSAPVKKTTAAPKPITPVVGSGGAPSVDEDSLSDAEWESRWKKKRG